MSWTLIQAAADITVTRVLMSNIDVSSIHYLEELETAMARFASETNDAIELVQRQIEKTIELLDQLVANRRRAVSALQSVYKNTDNDQDADLIGRQLEEAEDKLREAMKWRRLVEGVCAEYKKHVTQVSCLAGKHTDKARLFLTTRTSDLYDYVGNKPHSSRPAGVDSPWSKSDLSDAAFNSSLALPIGFCWVQLEDLVPLEMEQLPGEGDYRKGLSEEDMQEGLRLLRTRILPEIQQDSGAVMIEHFLALDLEEKRWGTNSLTDIFAAYFGDDSIQVNRYVGDRYFRIGNGRHRIKAAQDMGWSAVPGRIVEVPRPANQG